jgi:hypothetical protein
MTSACCSASVRAAAADSGWSSGALAHRRAQERQLRALNEGADFVLGARPRHALAKENERPLGPFQQVQRRRDVLRRRHHARRFGRALDLNDFVEGAFAPDDVVRHVEIGGAAATIDRVPGCHPDMVGNALHAIDAARCPSGPVAPYLVSYRAIFRRYLPGKVNAQNK